MYYALSHDTDQFFNNNGKISYSFHVNINHRFSNVAIGELNLTPEITDYFYCVSFKIKCFEIGPKSFRKNVSL